MVNLERVTSASEGVIERLLLLVQRVYHSSTEPTCEPVGIEGNRLEGGCMTLIGLELLVVQVIRPDCK